MLVFILSGYLAKKTIQAFPTGFYNCRVLVARIVHHPTSINSSQLVV